MSSKSGFRAFVISFLTSLIVGVLVGVVFVRFAGKSGGAGPAEGVGADQSAQASDTDSTDGRQGDGPGSSNVYEGFEVVPFKLTDQDGNGVTQSLFEGEVTALTFFFSSCPGPCPELTKAMAEIQDRTETGNASGMRLASISVDGLRDTPQVVKAFAQGYGADFDRWSFLTGDPETVRGLVTDSIGFDLREQPDYQIDGPGGVTMNNILHPTRILLIGPDRRVIGVYWYNDPGQIDKMIEDAASALG